jgi:hypothetical protein
MTPRLRIAIRQSASKFSASREGRQRVTVGRQPTLARGIRCGQTSGSAVLPFPGDGQSELIHLAEKRAMRRSGRTWRFDLWWANREKAIHKR